MQEENNSEITYIVKEGDYLYSIAKEYHTTVNDIKKLNNLENDFLEIGKILKLPFSKEENNYIKENENIYIIKEDDNLYSIAKDHDITINELIDYNDQGKFFLTVGSKILIPLKRQNNKRSLQYNENYIVKPGDTLYNIAKRFKLKIEKLIDYNNLPNNTLKIGQEIIIPKNNTIHFVKENESLETIAKEHELEIIELKELNNLITDELTIGQILIIPDIEKDH